MIITKRQINILNKHCTMHVIKNKLGTFKNLKNYFILIYY